jgi:hypothetical protein
MNGQVSRRRVAEFARLADLAADRPGAEVAKQLAHDEECAHLVEVCAAVRGLRVDAGPEPAFRARLRHRLVAMAEVNPPVADRQPVIPTPRRVSVRTGSPRSPRLAFLAGALAALVLITGLTLLASSRALPGDTLYAVKRSSEHLELALVHDPHERGLRQLSFARTRLEEIGQLLSRGGGVSLGPHTRTVAAGGVLAAGDADPVVRALDDMDCDTAQGAALLTTYAVSKQSDRALVNLSGWTAAQQDALVAMQTRLPGPAAERAAGSVKLLTRLAERVAQLRNDLTCGCLAQTGYDEFGPVPCSPCAAPPVQPGNQPGSSTPNGPPVPGQPSVTGHAGATTAPPPAGRSVPVTPTTPGSSGTVEVPNLPVTVSPSGSPLLCSLLGRLLCGGS